MLVEIDLALLAKNKGYDCNVIHFFLVSKSNKEFLGSFDNVLFNYNDDKRVLGFLPIHLCDESVSRPTLFDLQTWLRDSHNLSVEPISHKYTISQLEKLPRVFRYKINEVYYTNRFANYTDALCHGLMTALKSIKIKK